MGMEYRLRFEHRDREGLLQALGSLRAAVVPAQGDGAIDFRESAEAAMPDATFRLEAGGAYFCDYGGKGHEILGRVIVRLVSRCGRVTIEDYEA